MKRSELVTRIENYLLDTQHLDIPCSLGSDFKAAAEELVVLIENVGMLPPFKEPKKLSVMQDEEKYTMYYKWEPENETK